MTAKEKILVVDDEIEILRLLQAILESARFEVLVASTGSEGFRQAYQHHPDLILLDIKMPAMDGHMFRTRLREMDQEVPIIMISSYADAASKVQSLEQGADDYVTKPFEANELIARIHAVLRRNKASKTALQLARYEDKRLKIDFESYQLWLNGKLVELTPKEWRLLASLYRQRGRVIKHEQLLKQVWGEAYVNDRKLLKAHIFNLRHKLGDNGTKPRYIHSEREAGYRFQGYA